MAVKLFLDEDVQSKHLLSLLRSKGFDVETCQEAGLNAFSDDEILNYASSQKRAVLTKNCRDFLKLHEHEAFNQHYGILAVFQNAAPSKNMSFAEIAAAIKKLQASKTKIRGNFIVLNSWR